MGQNIKIKIAGNEYPLVASSPEMERMMRLAADAINQKLAGLLLTKMGHRFVLAENAGALCALAGGGWRWFGVG